jgi:hypothetical protein
MDGAQASSGTPSAEHEDAEHCPDSAEQRERTIWLLPFGEGATEAPTLLRFGLPERDRRSRGRDGRGGARGAVVTGSTGTAGIAGAGATPSPLMPSSGISLLTNDGSATSRAANATFKAGLGGS